MTSRASHFIIHTDLGSDSFLGISSFHVINSKKTVFKYVKNDLLNLIIFPSQLYVDYPNLSISFFFFVISQ